jgi:type IV secretion system protein VirB8
VSGADELDVYWRDAASWESDRLAGLRRSERRAWRGAICGWACAVLGAGALLLLVPLKQLMPFVVRVDNTTGIVDVVPVGTGHIGEAEAVTRYLLTHYVTVCERFNLATAESDYEECAAFHSAQRNQAWYALWNPINAASPLNLYKDGTTIRASVVSLSFFHRANGLGDLAQVRYVRRLRRAGSTQEDVTHWIATAQFAYTQPSQDPRARSWNPLGFKIVDFKPEPEILTESAAAGPAREATRP